MIEMDDDTAPELGPEFFARAERGKYYRRQLEALRQKVEKSAELAPDVRAAFPTDEAVNEALRQIIGQTKEVALRSEETAVPV